MRQDLCPLDLARIECLPAERQFRIEQKTSELSALWNSLSNDLSDIDREIALIKLFGLASADDSISRLEFDLSLPSPQEDFERSLQAYGAKFTYLIRRAVCDVLFGEPKPEVRRLEQLFFNAQTA